MVKNLILNIGNSSLNSSASILIETYLLEYSNLKGWWLTSDGKLFDVSSDGGPGDHMGFIYAIDNYKKLGLNSADSKALENYYQTELTYEIQIAGDKVIDKIYKNGNIRLIYSPHSKTFFAESNLFSYYRIERIQDALLNLNLPVSYVILDNNLNSDVNSIKISYQTFMSENNFNVLKRLRE